MKTRKEKISIIVCIAVTLLLIAALVFAVVKKNTDKPDTPPVNSETSDVTDTSDPSDTSDTTDTPSVPAIDPGTSGGDDEKPRAYTKEKVKIETVYETDADGNTVSGR